MKRKTGVRIAAIVALLVVVLGVAAGETIAQDDVLPANATVVVDQSPDEPMTVPEVDEVLPNDTGTIDSGGIDSLDDLDKYSDFQLWQFIAAPIAAYVIQFAKKKTQDAETMRFITWIVAAILAIVGAFLRGELTNVTYTVTTAMQLVLLTWASYEALLKATPLAGATAWAGALFGGPPAADQRQSFKGTGVTKQDK